VVVPGPLLEALLAARWVALRALPQMLLEAVRRPQEAEHLGLLRPQIGSKVQALIKQMVRRIQKGRLVETLD
jgi:hypothetical protein